MVWLTVVAFGYVTQNSIKTHISLQTRFNIELFPLQPRKLFVYVLIWKHKDFKFFWFKKIGTLCKLFDKLAQQVHPLIQEFFLFVSKGALFWQSWDVQAGESFRKGISQSQKVLIPALNLKRLQIFGVDAVNHKNLMIFVALIRHNLKVSTQFITVQITAHRHKSTILHLGLLLSFWNFSQSAIRSRLSAKIGSQICWLTIVEHVCRNLTF